MLSATVDPAIEELTDAEEPKLHLWTREEYYKMGEMGLFDGKHVELVGGRIFEMSPKKRPHVYSTTETAEILKAAFGQGWFVQKQDPINLGEGGEPEPDVAVIAGEDDDYKLNHPTTADLIVEVADATLHYDRKHKWSLYSRAGIKEYWILNLKSRRLEVYRRPIPMEKAIFGYGYADKVIYQEDDSVSPLAKPDVKIAVVDLLP
jgi:Uma2 family endonuclease